MKMATARAHPNIAFIKYWGNQNETLRLPSNPSLSMNLDGLYTDTSVHWDADLNGDLLIINGTEVVGQPLQRVSRHLESIRRRVGISAFARVESVNNFPMGTGIASSASAFAALTIAAVAASGETLDERELTTLARLGSGSACRSIPGGFVEWCVGEKHEESYAYSIASPDHWDLVDVIAIVSQAHKQVGSVEGHGIAPSSILQPVRVNHAPNRLQICREAILKKNFDVFAEVVELDTLLMHAVMMTSTPPLFYWEPTTLAIMGLVRALRSEGVRVCYTMDAGPNVHCICIREETEVVRNAISQLSDVVDIRVAGVGGPAKLLSDLASSYKPPL